MELLRTAAPLAHINGRVVVILEPIALYMAKDLYAPLDAAWLFPYPAPGSAIRLGEPRVYAPETDDLLIITYANGVPMSLRTAKRLRPKLAKRHEFSICAGLNRSMRPSSCDTQANAGACWS